MNERRKSNFLLDYTLPIVVVLFSIAGIIGRGMNLVLGYEAETALPIAHDRGEIGLIVTCCLTLLAAVTLSRRNKRLQGKPFEDVFGTENVLFKTISVVAGLLMIAAGGYGLVLAVTGQGGKVSHAAAQIASSPSVFNQVALYPLWILAILTGGCMIGLATALSRRNITESTASMTIIPMFWACFDLIITFKDNGASPFLGLYAFELLAAVFLTYAFYALAGMLYANLSPSRFAGAGCLAVVLCMTCAGGFAASKVLGTSPVEFGMETVMRYVCFFAAGLWLLAMLVVLCSSQVRTEHEDKNDD